MTIQKKKEEKGDQMRLAFSTKNKWYQLKMNFNRNDEGKKATAQLESAQLQPHSCGIESCHCFFLMET